MPFLIPLLLQVTMGDSPARAGMMMLPVAVASMSMKRLTTPLITRHGYRRVLVINTGLLGLTMASFVLVSPGQPLALRLVQLALLGAVNLMQFTAMNTLTLKDLVRSMASSGNSLLSMVQMLAMGMGVAAAGAVLAAFTACFGGEGVQGAQGVQTLRVFHVTFACMGLITVASAGIFWQLAPAESRLGPAVARAEAEMSDPG